MTTVGVVIPVYRCENYVRGCIESVLAQTRPVDQIVLVDDCGGDRSIDIAVETLREHGREHRVITQPRNGGLGRARNTGLAVLTTDLVWFLDSDDTAAPEFVDTLVSAMNAADAQMSVTRTYRVDEHDRVLQIDEARPLADAITGAEYARELLRGRAKAYACTKLFERASLGTRPWAEDQAYEDIATSIRVALSVDRVAMIETPLYRYLYREGSLSTAFSATTFDLFTADADVRALVAGRGRGSEWDRDYLGYHYREVLTSIAHVAMRADHADEADPELYRTAINEVRQGISLSDIPVLWAGGHRREIVFAVLMKASPVLYSTILRFR
ncbi:glycosyltransferase [Gordonia sp. (in: high G+C Gram-positive bacteria)]|jgi:glycosyltransferase involved in cell wall biosynthesis|uniref:glycosyltransferase n=1 Tax=Gordonia sp. (in: high G+C Gram-positive bacteria) TaxID=84139 RepID=UPI001DC0DFDF|nr:glycosyltransferase [Gordonia sp. (in: high G+C Gram-positive bacteria)]MCB1296080.1 glycosyltransferase family 2 protein [Gordonia sp. (in: high G+C Gram-positive bacteria)]HMS76235.1 glycosyltransferase [Gordonia sp. (in: high G+C Gram-positive bacteria)]HQV20362.1 glycosyltransferase [Gordonia sp. (in: high G+C Gram-positive bacteria)]